MTFPVSIYPFIELFYNLLSYCLGYRGLAWYRLLVSQSCSPSLWSKTSAVLDLLDIGIQKKSAIPVEITALDHLSVTVFSAFLILCNFLTWELFFYLFRVRHHFRLVCWIDWKLFLDILTSHGNQLFVCSTRWLLRIRCHLVR